MSIVERGEVQKQPNGMQQLHGHCFKSHICVESRPQMHTVCVQGCAPTELSDWERLFPCSPCVQIDMHETACTVMHGTSVHFCAGKHGPPCTYTCVIR